MKKEQYTEKADVFSFGIIMWELVGRTKPFDEYDIAKSSFTYQLEDAIIGGLRPTIPKGKVCPPAYVKLMETCWDSDPKVRPPFEDIYKEIGRIRDSLTSEVMESE